MAAVAYRYRVVRGEEVVATGRLTVEEPIEAGAPLELAGFRGTVRTIEPSLGAPELQLVIEVTPAE